MNEMIEVSFFHCPGYWHFWYHPYDRNNRNSQGMVLCCDTHCKLQRDGPIWFWWEGLMLWSSCAQIPNWLHPMQSKENPMGCCHPWLGCCYQLEGYQCDSSLELQVWSGKLDGPSITAIGDVFAVCSDGGHLGSVWLVLDIRGRQLMKFGGISIVNVMITMGMRAYVLLVRADTERMIMWVVTSIIYFVRLLGRRIGVVMIAGVTSMGWLIISAVAHLHGIMHGYTFYQAVAGLWYLQSNHLVCKGYKFLRLLWSKEMHH